MDLKLDKQKFLDDLKDLSWGTEKPIVGDGIIGNLYLLYDTIKGKYNFENNKFKENCI